MPFTFAHPAAVVPLLKDKQKYLIPSALVVGSIAPDIEYFLRLKLETKWSHTLPGILTFCLPMGFVLLWLFHTLQKTALYPLLPNDVRKFIPHPQSFSFLPLKQLGSIGLSIIIGAITHIVWDSFTHPNGYLVENMSFLRQPIQFWAIDLKLYQLLQDVSTFVGFLIIAIWLWRKKQKSQFDDHSASVQISLKMKFFTITSLLIGSILVGLLLSSSVRQGNSFTNIRDIFRHIAVIAIPSAYLVLTAFSIVFTRLKRKSGLQEIKGSGGFSRFPQDRSG